MLADLKRRARRASWVRGLLVGFFLGRARALGELREMPRFSLALLLAQARAVLSPVGDALVQAGQLDHAGDICFLSLPEVHAALDGADVRSIVRERRTQTQLREKRIPRSPRQGPRLPVPCSALCASQPYAPMWHCQYATPANALHG